MLSWLTGYDEENAARAAATEAGTYTRAGDGKAAMATAAWQQNQRDRGVWTEWEYQQSQRNMQASYDAGVTPESIDATFVESVKDNANLLAGGVKGALNAVGGTVWKAIPWWVWLVAGVALFIQLGGAEVIRGRIKRLA